jgi:hypothetical protein
MSVNVGLVTVRGCRCARDPPDENRFPAPEVSGEGDNVSGRRRAAKRAAMSSVFRFGDEGKNCGISFRTPPEESFSSIEMRPCWSVL